MAPANCCVHDDWSKQTLQALLLEVAVLKARSTGSSVDNIDFGQNQDIQPMTQIESDAALRHRLDSEYAAFVNQEQQMQQFYTHPPPPLPPNVIETAGDIFEDVPDDMALGHSVAEDLEMSAGVAVEFKRRFGQVDFLLSMGRRVGQVAVLPVVREDGSVRYVFYIITKKRSRGTRPNLTDFEAAVNNLADACTLLGVKQIALPRIGTMKDRLQWSDVRRIICAAFAGRKTEVYIYRKSGPRLPTTTQLVEFVDRMLQRTPPSDHHKEPDADGTPPFSTPDNATPSNQTPTPVGTWPCSLPDEGVHSAAPVGPCATKVVSDKNEDADGASSLETDTTKMLTTAQGPDRSVQIPTTPALQRFLNDIGKSSARRKRRSSGIPRPITPTNPPNNLAQTVIDITKSPNVNVQSVSQNQALPPNEAEAGRRPAVSLMQRSSGSQPVEPQKGVANNRLPTVNQNNQRAPIQYGGYRAYKHRSNGKFNISMPKNNYTKISHTQI
jgi:O-acetyl-ADP-ribose deacetylase (regulator of RNase III)